MTKQLVLQNWILLNYEVKEYLVNMHNWYLEPVQKYDFLHNGSGFPQDLQNKKMRKNGEITNAVFSKKV